MLRSNIAGNKWRWASASLVVFLRFAIELSAAEPVRPADRAAPPITADKPKRTVIRARVLMPDGSPAVGAMVTVNGHMVIANDRGGNRLVSNAQVTACDDKGEFSYDFPERVLTIAVRVKAPGTVASKDYPLAPYMDNAVQLLAGTRVSGRVLHQAKGVGGIQVALASVPEDSLQKQVVVTNDDGRFTIEHVHPERDHQLFVPMDSIAAKNLSAVVQQFRSGHEGQLMEVAEINLHPACKVRGKIVLSDRSNPWGLSVIIARAGVSDGQPMLVDEDGTFLFQGVPREPVTLWFDEGSTGRRDYRPSPKNYSLDPVQKNSLCGRVDEDLDLTVLLEPITIPERTLRAAEDRAAQTQAILEAQRARAQAQVLAQQARVAVKVNGGRLVVQNAPYAPSDERTARQKQLQGEPLRGISEATKRALPAAK